MLATKGRFTFPVAAFVLLTSAFAAGCGGATVEEICSKCESDSALVEACIKDSRKQQTLIENAGCGSEFQSFLNCLADNGTCRPDGSIEVDACEDAQSITFVCASRE